MKKYIFEYKECTKKILKEFGCEDNYLIKDLTSFEWGINNEEGTYFLSYWKKEEPKNNLLIAKSDKLPLIYKTKDYTMIIVIECIKIAVIFKNKEQV
jgi:hypothetical protein